MEPLDAAKLIEAGYTEDPEALKQFERRYFIPIVLPLANFVIMSILALFGIVSEIPVIASFVALFFIGIAIAALMYYSNPLSRFSGLPLKKYRSLVPKTPGRELLYVCPESKTFFRRIHAKPKIKPTVFY
ncbi:hypothetical protein [Thiothrix unzii]|uniref:Uncharacterized protein n=1 Tax=Thiothrix unzii TaxID=111769 RepID=A0A975IFN4_9GAMM|nr:hypothetical protein [Thiothrix unzii]QTR52011.1 hypothetical protein J9260_09610 [Thiothrix unzii]